MKLLVGLGNYEEKYLNTFHNLGFLCIDRTAKMLNVEFNKTKCRALIAETKVNNEKVILAKPLTFMNLSGESVRELVNFYKIDKKDIIVAYDDFDLSKGSLRIRESGSAGTHNGMRNIVENLAFTGFPRVRIGFKPSSDSKIPLINYVLSNISKEDSEILDNALEMGAKALYDFAHNKDIQQIMQSYNKKA